MKGGVIVNKLVVFKDFCVESENCYYSIDMIRLRTRFTTEFFMKKIDSRVSILSNVEKWESSRIGDFRYNYNVVLEDGNSFWFGFISNKDLYCGDGGINNPSHKFNFTIEFNPNKINNCKLLDFLLSLRYEDFLQVGLNWEVVSCDFAFDIPTNILNLTGFDKKRKKCITTFDNGGDDKTYYIGKGQNRVKIYNKRIESGLDYDLTRIELTHKFQRTLDIRYLNSGLDLKIGSYFPELFLKDYQMEIEDLQLDSTFKIILFAVNNGYPLNELTGYYRRKVKNYLKEKKPIVIDFQCFNKAFISTIRFWFNDLLVC